MLVDNVDCGNRILVHPGWSYFFGVILKIKSHSKDGDRPKVQPTQNQCMHRNRLEVKPISAIYGVKSLETVFFLSASHMTPPLT